MNASRVTLGLYWGPRRQDLDSCTADCVATLSLLRDLGYEDYYQKSRSRADGLRRPIEISAPQVRNLLMKGVNRTDIGGQPISELGFNISAWSGGTDEGSYSLSIHCGCDSKYVSNVLLFALWS